MGRILLYTKNIRGLINEMNDLILDFPTISDQRGTLVALEQNKNIPFEIKRVYYIYGINQKETRVLMNQKLEQVIICVSGLVK